MIKLNVGGKIFQTTETTLRKSEYFSSLLSRWNISDEIVVDDDPKLFRHVLNSLRHGDYEIPSEDKENVFKLLTYYGVKFQKIPTTIWRAKSHTFCGLGPNEFKFYGKLLDLEVRDGYEPRSVQIFFEGALILGDFVFFKKDRIKDYLSGLEGDFLISVSGWEKYSEYKAFFFEPAA